MVKQINTDVSDLLNNTLSTVLDPLPEASSSYLFDLMDCVGTSDDDVYVEDGSLFVSKGAGVNELVFHPDLSLLSQKVIKGFQLLMSVNASSTVVLDSVGIGSEGVKDYKHIDGVLVNGVYYDSDTFLSDKNRLEYNVDSISVNEQVDIDVTIDLLEYTNNEVLNQILNDYFNIYLVFVNNNDTVIEFTNLKLNMLFSNALQDEIDVIKNRLGLLGFDGTNEEGSIVGTTEGGTVVNNYITNNYESSSSEVNQSLIDEVNMLWSLMGGSNVTDLELYSNGHLGVILDEYGVNPVTSIVLSDDGVLLIERDTSEAGVSHVSFLIREGYLVLNYGYGDMELSDRLNNLEELLNDSLSVNNFNTLINNYFSTNGISLSDNAGLVTQISKNTTSIGDLLDSVTRIQSQLDNSYRLVDMYFNTSTGVLTCIGGSDSSDFTRSLSLDDDGCLVGLSDADPSVENYGSISVVYLSTNHDGFLHVIQPDEEPQDIKTRLANIENYIVTGLVISSDVPNRSCVVRLVR